MVSTTNRVGVDIEIPRDKIGRIKQKFLSSEELETVLGTNIDSLHALTLAWSIKEAMFKWYGNGKVDFREHMHIHSIRSSDFNFIASCSFTKDSTTELEAFALMFNDISLAFLVS